MKFDIKLEKDVFGDERLYKVVLQNYKEQNGKKFKFSITKGEVASIKKLTIPKYAHDGKSVIDLRFLRHMPNLTDLTIFGNYTFRNAYVLKELKHLRWLMLDDCYIEDMPDLPQLETFVLGITKGSALRIRKLVNNKTFYDLEYLKHLPNLNSLLLETDKSCLSNIINIDKIGSYCKKLSSLCIDGPYKKTSSFIEMKYLIDVELEETNFEDVSYFLSLPKMRYLHIKKTQNLTNEQIKLLENKYGKIFSYQR